MDSAFRVPGTGIRFGLDPIIGALPTAASPMAVRMVLTWLDMIAPGSVDWYRRVLGRRDGGFHSASSTSLHSV